MSSSRFCFQQWSSRWYCLLTLRRIFTVGLLISVLPQYVTGLDCYDCTHAASPGVPPGLISTFLPGKENPGCIDPKTSNSVTKKTCTDPNESCLKGYAGGTVPGFGLKLSLLIRQCFLHSTGQSVADGCTDYTGIAFGSNFTFNWGAAARSLPKVLTETLQSLHKGVAASESKGRQFSDMDVTGTYCLCKDTDLCNNAPGMEVVNTGGGGGGGGNPSTTTSTPNSNSNTATTTPITIDPSADRSSIQIAQPQQLIFSFVVSIIIVPSLFLNIS